MATGKSLSNNLCKLDIEFQEDETRSKGNAFHAMSRPQPESMHIWHQRLGQNSIQILKRMQTFDMVKGLHIKKTEAQGDEDLFCEGCVYGKHPRLPFPSEGRTRATRVGGLIHSDLVGPISTPSFGGSKYFVVFRDDYSCF